MEPISTILGVAGLAMQVKDHIDKKRAEREAEEARAQAKARILFCVFVILPIIIVVAVLLIWGLPKPKQDNSNTASRQSQEYFVMQPEINRFHCPSALAMTA